MRHGSLESGIGGIDYAAEQMGWENVFHVEINTFCQTILKYYWPNADSYTDIFGFDGRPYRGSIDIITCGFPCQPFSVAGNGKGDKDDRFLWPENMRIIREIQPAYVVAENVPGLLSKHPLVFERVCTDLEDEGYEVVPVNIPACAAGADHIRQRLFFVAYNSRFRRFQQSNGEGIPDRERYFSSEEQEWNEQQIRIGGGVECGTANNNGKCVEGGGASSRTVEKGRNPETNSIMDAIASLSTLNARDWEGCPSEKYQNASLPKDLKQNLGLKLQPAFAAWMMALPEDWTLRPFLKQNGTENQSEDTVTPSTGK